MQDQQSVIDYVMNKLKKKDAVPFEPKYKT